MIVRVTDLKAVYAGTFDPITNGHLDIIKRSLSFCNRLVVAIGVNPEKKTMFSDNERQGMIARTLYKELGDAVARVDIVSFQGLLVDYAKQTEAHIIIRGIRSVSDFEYEINLANINKVLAPKIETVFLPTNPELAVVSSSAAKEIARHGGDISKFVCKHVAEEIDSKFGFTKHGDPQK
jgi:pantetheine-phosphate adenylyltransferase